MNNKMVLFGGTIVATVICLAISIYYIIPGYDHVLVTQGSTLAHPKHAAAFLALAVICAIVALVTRPKAVASKSRSGN